MGSKFRCKHCKLEYSKSPDYCNCGNNLFEEIFVNSPFIGKHHKVKEFLNASDIFSTLIFIICIILSVLAWNFIN